MLCCEGARLYEGPSVLLLIWVQLGQRWGGSLGEMGWTHLRYLLGIDPGGVVPLPFYSTVPSSESFLGA